MSPLRPYRRAGFFFYRLMKTRISLIAFDRKERLKRATIHTRAGIVKVTWVNMDGDACWFTSGPLEARRLAAETIQKIERMASQS